MDFASTTAATLWCDYVGVIYLSANLVCHAYSKHIELDYHFAREKVICGTIYVWFVSPDDQIADIFHQDNINTLIIIRIY